MAQESIGGLWIKQGKAQKFLSGSIKLDGKEYQIIVFKNDKGDNPKRPDYRIFPSQPRGGSTAGYNPNAPRPEPAHASGDDFTDDIPF